MKNVVFWDLRRVVLVRTDVSEERIASIIRVTRIAQLGTLAVISNRITQPSSKGISSLRGLVTLRMEAMLFRNVGFS
jgi:hypothetical protein